MKIPKLFLHAGLLILMAGCASEVPYRPSVNTIADANVSANIKQVADARVETDQYLSQLLYLTEIRESQTNDGYRRIQIFLKNLSGSTYTVMYRFNWYDDNGVEVENPDNEMWVRKIIVAGDDLTLTSVAPQQKCKDFKLRLKAAY